MFLIMFNNVFNNNVFNNNVFNNVFYGKQLYSINSVKSEIIFS